MISYTRAELKHKNELIDLLTILFSREGEFTPNERKQSDGLELILSDSRIGTIYIALDDKKVIGMVSILNTVSTALGTRVGILEDMIIHPEFQGNGIGGGLIRYAMEAAQTEGLGRITLLTDSDNSGAVRFYTSNGFAKSGMIPMRRQL